MAFGLPEYQPDPDELAGAARWVAANVELLASMTDLGYVNGWYVSWRRPLLKLHGQSEELYERVMAAYSAAVERTRIEW